MAAYSALELPYARPVACAILESGVFRDWFLAGTKHEASLVNARTVGAIQGGLRSKTMRNPWWFNYWCGKDSRCSCRIGSGIETDILLILDCINGRRLALHIETKGQGTACETAKQNRTHVERHVGRSSRRGQELSYLTKTFLQR